MKRYSVNICARFVMLFVVSLTVSGCFSAKIMSCTVYSPKYFLCDDGKNNVFVEPLEYKGGDYIGYGKYYASELIYALNRERRGIYPSVKCFNPWITTKLYNVVDNKDDADIIIYGYYSTEYDSGRSERRCEEVIETVEERKVESDDKDSDDSEDSDDDSEKEEEIEVIVTTETIVYYEYEAWQRVDLDARIRVRYSHDGTFKPWYYDISDHYTDRDVKRDAEPVLYSASYVYDRVGRYLAYDHQYDFSPEMSEMEYVFSKVKANKKSNKRLFKIYNSLAKGYCKEKNVEALGKLYYNMLRLEQNAKLSKNMGLCYELIGNYSKAKDCYSVMTDNKKDMSRIERLIRLRDRLQKTGLEIVEYDFY